MEQALTPEHPTSRSVLRRAGKNTEGDLTPEQRADVEENKDVAAMSYLWILSIVVLSVRGDSPFIRHHARQGAVLFFISIPLWLVPVVGRPLEFLVLAGMIIGFLNAAQGRSHDLPVVGALAKGTLTVGDIWQRGVRGVKRATEALKKGILPGR